MAHQRLPGLGRPSRSTPRRLQLAHPSFIEHVTEALGPAGLDPTALIVEVTESVLATDSRTIIATLDELRGTGVRVAIDDFGTGYSSFAALADLPIDILKIDKRFIDNLVHDDQGRGSSTPSCSWRTRSTSKPSPRVSSTPSSATHSPAGMHPHPGLPLLTADDRWSDPGLSDQGRGRDPWS